MKSLLSFLLLSSFAISAFAGSNIPKCFDVNNDTDAIIRGDNFDPENLITYYSDRNAPNEISKDYRILSYSEPRFVKSDKLSFQPPYESCKSKWTFAVVDYTMELPNGIVCQDTYSTPYSVRMLFTSCPAISILTADAPIHALFTVFNAKSKREKLSNKIDELFENNLK